MIEVEELQDKVEFLEKLLINSTKHADKLRDDVLHLRTLAVFFTTMFAAVSVVVITAACIFFLL